MSDELLEGALWECVVCENQYAYKDDAVDCEDGQEDELVPPFIQGGYMATIDSID